MLAPRRSLALILALTCSAMAGVVTGAAQAPKIGKPVPAPTTKLPPLPPAVIDDKLLIGGEDINARKVNTRMTVEVQVNGRGPYRFLVDSGADSSVVGLRIAQDLQLPLGTPTILHAMTSSARVERVLVDELTLGQSTIRESRASRPARTGSGWRRNDRHRRAGRTAVDDGFRKTRDQGRRRPAASQDGGRRNRGDSSAAARPADPDPGERRADCRSMQ